MTGCWSTRPRPMPSTRASCGASRRPSESPFYLHLVRHPSGMIQSFEEPARPDLLPAPALLLRRQLAELIWDGQPSQHPGAARRRARRAPAARRLRGPARRPGAGGWARSASVWTWTSSRSWSSPTTARGSVWSRVCTPSRGCWATSSSAITADRPPASPSAGGIRIRRAARRAGPRARRGARLWPGGGRGA